MTTQNLLSAYQFYQRHFMHALVWFGLGMDGLAALDTNERRN